MKNKYYFEENKLLMKNKYHFEENIAKEHPRFSMDLQVLSVLFYSCNALFSRTDK